MFCLSKIQPFITGSSIAYWLKQRVPRSGLSVTVIEKDPAYTRCSTGNDDDILVAEVIQSLRDLH